MSGTSGTTSSSGKPLPLCLSQVSVSFAAPNGPLCALDRIDLELQPGEFVAIQGPSGCGKTTLLLAAGTLLRPGSGSVSVCGCDPYRLGADARSRFRAQHIGFVFQQFHLVPYLNVLENVLTPLLGQVNRAARDRARGLLDALDMTARLDHLPSMLSTGERQRTALARALVAQPSLLLADEPTGNLDDRNAELVLQHLQSFAAADGAVLLATHDARVAREAGRALVMTRGCFDEAACA